MEHFAPYNQDLPDPIVIYNCQWCGRYFNDDWYFWDSFEPEWNHDVENKICEECEVAEDYKEYKLKNNH